MGQCVLHRQARNHSLMCWHVWHSFQPDVVKMLTTAAPKYTVYRCCKTMSVVVVDGNLNPYWNTLRSITTWIIWPTLLLNIWVVIIVGCCLATNSLNSNKHHWTGLHGGSELLELTSNKEIVILQMEQPQVLYLDPPRWYAKWLILSSWRVEEGSGFETSAALTHGAHVTPSEECNYYFAVGLFKRKQYSTWCDLTGYTTLPHEFPVRLQLRGSETELCTQTEIEFLCVCKERLPERFPECG